MIPSVSPSGRTTWIEYREWELKGYSDAYEEIRRANFGLILFLCAGCITHPDNFGEIDADFSDLKSPVKETGVGRVGEVVNLKTPLDKMRTYVEAKQSLSGLEEPPTEFLEAFNQQKRNYNDTKEKIRETDLQIREALRQQSELVNLDDKIKSLQEEIRVLEGKTEPLDAELEVLRQTEEWHTSPLL